VTDSDTRTKMLHSWIAAEHARLHLVAEWPESARKRTLLKAIRSSIRSLTADRDAATFSCVMCRSTRVVLARPGSPRLHGMAA
jgi:hypothetical protein